MTFFVILMLCSHSKSLELTTCPLKSKRRPRRDPYSERPGKTERMIQTMFARRVHFLDGTCSNTTASRWRRQTHFSLMCQTVEDGVRVPASIELGKHMDLYSADRGDVDRSQHDSVQPARLPDNRRSEAFRRVSILINQFASLAADAVLVTDQSTASTRNWSDNTSFFLFRTQSSPHYVDVT